MLPPLADRPPTARRPGARLGPCPRRPAIRGFSASSRPPRGRASRSKSGSSTSRRTPPQDAATALGAELGQIVKSLVFVAPGDDGDARADRLPRVRPEPGRSRPAGRGHRRARRPASDGPRGRRADRLLDRRHPAVRPCHADARRHGPRPRPSSRSSGPPPGLPTAVFPVPPGTLRTLANAMVAPITEEPPPGDTGAREARGGASAGSSTTAAPPPRTRECERGRRRAAHARRQPHDATIVYPGGLRARWRWGGSGEGPAVFALSEAGGTLIEHGALAGVDVRGAVPRRAADRRAGRGLDGPARVAHLRRAGRGGLGRPRACSSSSTGS